MSVSFDKFTFDFVLFLAMCVYMYTLTTIMFYDDDVHDSMPFSFLFSRNYNVIA